MWKPSVMVFSNLVKEEIDEELSEVKASEKFLHDKVAKLEKRNRKLEKKVIKLKAQKKELKQELAKFLGHAQTLQDIEVLDEDDDQRGEEEDNQHRVYHH